MLSREQVAVDTKVIERLAPAIREVYPKSLAQVPLTGLDLARTSEAYPTSL